MDTPVEQKPVLEYMDLLYFGYDWSEESESNQKDQSDFITEIKERFPNVKLVDVYDQIKGFRQEVYLEESDEDNYYSWLYGKQWYRCSFSCNVMMMSRETEHKEKFNKYFALAKKQYPEAFKPEAL